MIIILLNMMVYPFSFGEACVSTRSPFSEYYNPANRPEIAYYSIALSTSRIGGIEYLGLDRSFKSFSIGIATSDSVLDRKSWVSFSSRISNLSIGLGGGFDHKIRPVLLGGLFFDNQIYSLGLSYRYGTYKALQGGAGVNYQRFLGGLEIERTAFDDDSTRIYPHLGLGYELSDAVILQAGYYRGGAIGISSAIGPLLVCFGVDRLTFEDLRLHFGIYSIVREKVIKKTITKIRVKKVPVEKKIYVPTKTKQKTQVEKGKKTPSAEELKFCDEHYRRGIDYYNQDKLQEALREWKKVQKICPGYLLVEEYLDKAKKKLNLLKGIK